jgi:hypothetical protein
MVAVFNFSGAYHGDFALPVPNGNSLTLLIASDQDRWGGNIPYEEDASCPVTDGQVTLDMPAFSGKLFVVE